MLVDAHCHIDAKRFDGERAEMLARARHAGVRRFITIGCDVANSRRALGLAATHPDVFATVGVHPHEAGEAGAADAGFEEALRDLAGHPKCVGIGECGLDYYYDHSPREVQREVFATQVGLAQELGKKLMIHVRDAWEDCVSILRSAGGPNHGGVIHCFTGGPDQAREALDLGFHLSIPGVLTFKNAADLVDAVKEAPLDRLLVETDSPYLAPVPHRGKRNEPAFVVEVARKIAELKDMSLEAVVQQTGKNAATLFGLPA
jgi:TatD DNase family protein